MSALLKPDEQRVGYKLLLYVSFCLSGRAFPTGNIPADRVSLSSPPPTPREEPEEGRRKGGRRKEGNEGKKDEQLKCPAVVFLKKISS
jgi:hypothetical protein